MYPPTRLLFATIAGEGFCGTLDIHSDVLYKRVLCSLVFAYCSAINWPFSGDRSVCCMQCGSMLQHKNAFNTDCVCQLPACFCAGPCWVHVSEHVTRHTSIHVHIQVYMYMYFEELWSGGKFGSLLFLHPPMETIPGFLTPINQVTCTMYDIKELWEEARIKFTVNGIWLGLGSVVCSFIFPIGCAKCPRK